MQTFQRRGATAARIALGLLFFVFGLNGFLHFLPTPPMPAAAGAFAGALFATGYMFPLIKGTEVIAATLLLTNRLVALALVLLAPIVVNIVAFHTFLTPPNPIALLTLALELYLAWSYRDAYRSVLAVRVAPTVSDPAKPNGTAEREGLRAVETG